jgi:hypothetical protein
VAEDPITGGLTLAEKLFTFFTGEKFTEGMKDRAGKMLQHAADEALDRWKADPTEANWHAYKKSEQVLATWSNSP